MRPIPLPVMLWLSAAFLSFAASVGCWFFVDKQTGLYIGLWVPSILALGGLLNSVPTSRAVEAVASRRNDAKPPLEAR